MEIHVTHEDGCVVARTVGPIDESAEALFREHLHPRVRQRGTHLVLDLSQSQLISSLGVGQLVMLVANANTAGSRVVLTAISPFVSIVLGRCKLDKFFETAASVPDAIRLLSEKAAGSQTG